MARALVRRPTPRSGVQRPVPGTAGRASRSRSVAATDRCCRAGVTAERSSPRHHVVQLFEHAIKVAIEPPSSEREQRLVEPSGVIYLGTKDNLGLVAALGEVPSERGAGAPAHARFARQLRGRLDRAQSSTNRPTETEPTSDPDLPRSLGSLSVGELYDLREVSGQNPVMLEDGEKVEDLLRRCVDHAVRSDHVKRGASHRPATGSARRDDGPNHRTEREVVDDLWSLPQRADRR